VRVSHPGLKIAAAARGFDFCAGWAILFNMEENKEEYNS
jgi:hypothetical protein